MPAVIALLRVFFGRAAAWLLTFAGPMLVKVMLAFGVSFATYHLGMAPFLAYIQSSLGGAGSLVIGIFAGLHFDKAVTIILSAHIVARSARMVLTRTPT